MRKTGIAMAISLALLPAAAQMSRTPAPADAEVYIVAPADGATVTSPVRVVFGLRGMGVAPAGIQVPETGHHHLLIDAELEGEALDQPIPSDEHHVHFGKGQTETTVELEPGEHTLQLVLGDFSHIPHDPPVMSERITIHVE